MITRIKSLLKSRVTMCVFAILIPVFLSELFGRHDFRLDNVAMLLIICSWVIAITICFTNMFEGVWRMLFLEYGSILRCVVVSMVILEILVLSTVIKLENYFFLDIKRTSSLPFIVNMISISILITFWTDAIQKKKSKKSMLLAVSIILIIQLVQLYMLKQYTFVVLEQTIIVTSILVWAAGKALAKEKIIKKWLVWVTTVLFFIFSSIFLIAIKLVSDGKIYSVSKYEHYRKWSIELLKNAKPIGMLQSNFFDAYDERIWYYKNWLHQILFEDGWVPVVIYALSIVIFLVIAIRMVAIGRNTFKRVSYFPGLACVTYLILKFVFSISFTLGALPDPVNLLFADHSLVDFMALGIIIHSYNVESKIENQNLKVDGIKMLFTSNLFNTDENIKLKVINGDYAKRRFFGTLMNEFKDMLSPLTLLNGKDMEEYKFDIEDELFYNEDVYYVLRLLDDPEFIVILKEIDDEKYSYVTVDESIQSEVFNEYKQRIREMYL